MKDSKPTTQKETEQEKQMRKRGNLQRIVQITQFIAQTEQIITRKEIVLPYCKLDLTAEQIEEVKKAQETLKSQMKEIVGAL